MPEGIILLLDFSVVLSPRLERRTLEKRTLLLGLLHQYYITQAINGINGPMCRYQTIIHPFTPRPGIQTTVSTIFALDLTALAVTLP